MVIFFFNQDKGKERRKRELLPISGEEKRRRKKQDGISDLKPTLRRLRGVLSGAPMGKMKEAYSTEIMYLMEMLGGVF